ncbi:hypothetical protein G5B40_01910 [Pikeienuella piscinae]|uniref:Lipoprotein n=1 Tax=Pikeienuella piscinae TaxID=2748098 RepID=A0A7L5BV23_9RHOB|nr:hypothetical protein [Pikeienuella piscinae]QIE54307.1 hypothetical protein G5B40_01910 [Pikeienuella piscinae]
MSRIAPILTAAALLCACAGPGADVVTRNDISPNYQPIWVSVFSGAGGQATILGSTSDGASADEIAAAIRLPAHVSQRTIRAAPPAEAQGGPHLVLVFAPKGDVTARKACRGEVAGGVAGSELKVFGAFCTSYGSPVTEGLLSLPDSPTPSDPDFGRRMSYLLNALMPATNPEAGEGCFMGGC